MVSASLALLGLVYVFSQLSLALSLEGGWRLAAVAPAPCLAALVVGGVAVGILGGQGGIPLLFLSLPAAVAYFAGLAALHALCRLRRTRAEGG